MSPHDQPQPDVVKCPRCTGDIACIASRNKIPPYSHKYLCRTCGKKFEINELE